MKVLFILGLFVLLLKSSKVFSQNTSNSIISSSSTNVIVQVQECVESDSIPSRRWIVPSVLLTNGQGIPFELGKNPLNCNEDERQVVELSWMDVDANEGQFLPTGYLKFRDESYHPSEYCIRSISDGSVTLQICPVKDDCKGLTCIRKCCPLDNIYKFKKGGCSQPQVSINPLQHWTPKLYKGLDRPLTPEESNRIKIHYIEAKPKGPRFPCSEGLHIGLISPQISAEIEKELDISLPIERYVLLQDGQILLQKGNGKCSQLKGDFCVDSLYDYGDNSPFRNIEEEQILFTCSPAGQEDEAMKIGKAYGIIMICSSLFLVLTLIVYFLLWDKQTVHGWSIMSYSGTLFFFYIVYGIIHHLEDRDFLESGVCKIISIIGHFLSLSVFAWLTVISFDLWWTFGSLRPTNNKRSKGGKKYLWYCLCAWGIPLLLTLTSVLIDQTLGRPSPDHCLTWTTPGYGRESCSIDRDSLGLYLYYPAGILLIVNLSFFVTTLIKLLNYHETTRFAHQNTQEERKMFKVLAKLFFVMGITWIFEVISWLATKGKNNKVWIIFDVINILQALAIFIIFVLKEDILLSLEERHPVLGGCLSPLRRMIGCSSRKGNKSGGASTSASKRTKETSLNTSEGMKLKDVHSKNESSSETEG